MKHKSCTIIRDKKSARYEKGPRREHTIVIILLMGMLAS